MVKALDPQNQGVHPHPLSVHHPNHYRVLAGGRAHNRIRSCHKHQKSKLYMVPNIVTHIEVLFDIVIINLRYRILLFNFEENTIDIGPNIQIWRSLPLNIGPYIESFLQYRRNWTLISSVIKSDGLCHPSAHDIKCFYSISDTKSNTISAYKKIRSNFYRHRRIFIGYRINRFHIRTSGTICVADVGYDIMLTCWTCQSRSRRQTDIVWQHDSEVSSSSW